MCEFGVERGWSDLVFRLHRQQDSSLGGYVEGVGVGVRGSRERDRAGGVECALCIADESFSPC